MENDMTNQSDITLLTIYAGKGKNTFIPSQTLYTEAISTHEQEIRQYRIPRYQREFAWGEDRSVFGKYNPIEQLIDDIMESHGTYYLGSLVVCHKTLKENPQEDFYEVIDGQQRLTTLYLVLSHLGIDKQFLPQLTYEQRPRATTTLALIADKHDLSAEDRDKELDEDIDLGFRLIQEKLSMQDKEKFIQKLQNVRLFRIKVPQETDVNHYFEIMNTRGKQLEQADIVKAKLLGFLPPQEQPVFVDIWHACSNMDGYAQLHIFYKNRNTFLSAIGPNSILWETICQQWKISNSQTKKENLETILASDKQSTTHSIPNNNITNNQESTNDKRFKSIIDFPHFLLHALSIFVKMGNATSQSNRTFLSMEDHNLSATFQDYIPEDEEAKKQFSQKFIIHLAKCRHLFDKYFIKRDFDEDTDTGKISDQAFHDSSDTFDDSGEWSLKFPQHYQGKDKEKYYYPDTFKDKHILMLQACLRVSYTSPKSMDWITNFLTWLYKDEQQLLFKKEKQWEQTHQKNLSQAIIKQLKQQIVSKIKDSGFLNSQYNEGTNTPHIVFNYLDYLLWKNLPPKAQTTFKFKFRNSVEHFHPRHAIGAKTTSQYQDNLHQMLDHFGNLCLLTRKRNSLVSNRTPIAKVYDFNKYQKDLWGESLKLQKMVEIIKQYQKDSNVVDANEKWIEEGYKAHETEMLLILQAAIK